MKRASAMKGLLMVVLCSLFYAIPTRAIAEDWPLIPGDFYEVTGVNLKDGGGLSYANFLATEWKADQEFAKSKGWIKSYMILSNPYARKGEPDLFLIVVSERLPAGSDAEKRNSEYMAWKKKTLGQMQKESGNRAEIREVSSNSLMQELKFRK